MPDLSYPRHWGCAGWVSGGGAPHPCENPPTVSVVHTYRYPRPHTTRLAACPEHAAGELDPQPLTDAQRADLARRRRVHDEAIARRDANRARAEQQNAPPDDVGQGAQVE